MVELEKPGVERIAIVAQESDHGPRPCLLALWQLDQQLMSRVANLFASRRLWAMRLLDCDRLLVGEARL